MKPFVAILICGLPVWAQYAGPAVLSRGDIPSAMEAPQLSFRPFVEVNAIYDTGLTGVGLTSEGQLPNISSGGVQVAGGVSGAHSWRHTQIGVDYYGDVREYPNASFYDGTDQSLMLGIKHQFTRHIYLNLRESAGEFNYGGGVQTLSEAVPFDPAQSYVPATDFFDNRVFFGTTQADLIIQRSARLSFDLGGDGFINRQRSAALIGVDGAAARGDVQYRLSRYTTIGANYTYTHFSFNHIYSSTDINGAAGTYAVQFNRTTEFTGYGGFMRLESKFIQDVPVDPTVAAIIGITESPEVIYSVRYIPNISARLSRTFEHGVAYITGGHTVTPGNGLFLTSSMTQISVGYTYTGLRRWSFHSFLSYQKMESIGNVIGEYGGWQGTASLSRQVTRSVHFIAAFNARDYNSKDFPLYNHTFYDARVGIGFAPGDVPLRVW